jgi:hypothetical protein
LSLEVFSQKEWATRRSRLRTQYFTSGSESMYWAD